MKATAALTKCVLTCSWLSAAIVACGGRVRLEEQPDAPQSAGGQGSAGSANGGGGTGEQDATGAGGSFGASANGGFGGTAAVRDAGFGGSALIRGDWAVTAAPRDTGALRSSRGDLALPRSTRVRDRLASEWLADALAEHSSIASFARAALELVSLGAPRKLVIAHLAAGRDEIEHAQACLSMASALFGRRLEPGSLPEVAPRRLDLEELAAATFEEAVVGETVAALSASRAARECAEPAARSLLTRIARDETRHAALAWQTIRWAIRRGGASVADCLRERAAACRPARAVPRGGACRSRFGELGRLDAVALATARDDAWHEVTHPILASVLS